MWKFSSEFISVNTRSILAFRKQCVDTSGVLAKFKLTGTFRKIILQDLQLHQQHYLELQFQHDWNW